VNAVPIIPGASGYNCVNFSIGDFPLARAFQT